MREIFCDEAGYTGPDLLNPDQPAFAYASVSISDLEAWEIIRRARELCPVQMPELKAANLIKSSAGRALIARVVQEVSGRFAVNVHDKLLALCGWIFEYIFEPVFKDDPSLLYEKNLHRFVAMFTWLWLKTRKDDPRRTLSEFQNYMRSRDPDIAPSLFAQIRKPLGDSGSEDPFELVLRFAYGYRDIIVADNANLDTLASDGGKWVLDLSASGIWSHLNYWGQKSESLRVICDVNKPIQAIIPKFTGDEHDPAISRARMMGHTDPLGWKLAEPILFGNSRDHPSIQLADIIAGTAAALYSRPVPDGFQETHSIIWRHLLPDCVVPDMDVVDLKSREAAVNFLILYDLAKRAERGADPFHRLEEMYHVAEVSWTRGDLDSICTERVKSQNA